MDGNVDRATFEAFLADREAAGRSRPWTGVHLARSPATPSRIRATGPSTPADRSAWTTGFDDRRPAVRPRSAACPADSLAPRRSCPAAASFDSWYAAVRRRPRERDLRSAGGAGGASRSTAWSAGCDAPLSTTFYLEAVVSTGGRAYVFTMSAHLAPGRSSQVRSALDPAHAPGDGDELPSTTVPPTLDWPPQPEEASRHVLRRPRQHPAPAPHPASRPRRQPLRRGAVRGRGLHRPELAPLPPRAADPDAQDRAGPADQASKPPTTTSIATA